MDEGTPVSGGSVVPGARVRVSAEVVRVGRPAPSAAGAEPKVQAFHQDGEIQLIEVTCTCGERICIHCEY
jgi:hypothetical protein